MHGKYIGRHLMLFKSNEVQHLLVKYITIKNTNNDLNEIDSENYTVWTLTLKSIN